MKCSICKEKYTGFGNNAQPINNGRCCDRCNRMVVVPIRINEITKDKSSALLFKIDGTIETVKPKGEYFELDELQALIGGFIELYPKRLTGKLLVICDEEGKIKKLKLNRTFAAYAKISLVGNILVCPEKIFEKE